MLCPRCNGQGFSVIAKWKCPVCHGTGFVEQTNEEWLRTLPTTEELAKAIFKCIIANSWSFNEQVILRWLKEVHRESE